MASDEGKKGPTPPDNGSAPKKPTALIDLKATELKDEKPKAGPASPTGAPTGATPPAGSSAAAAAAASGSVPPTGSKAAPSAEANRSDKPAAPKPAEPATKSAARSNAGPIAETALPRASRASPLGSALTHTIAGLVGGLLALLAADTVGPQLGMGPRKDVPDAVQKRLAEVEQRVAGLARAPEGTAALVRTVGAAEKRISELEQSTSRLAALEAQNAKLADEAKSLREAVQKGTVADPRISKLQDQLQTLSAAAGTDADRGRIPQLAAITGKVADLEATISNQLGQIRKTLGQEIDQRLHPVAEASEAARAGTQRLDRDVAAVKTDAARLGERAEANNAAVDRLEQAVRSVEHQAQGLKAALDGFKNDVAGELKSLARPADVAAAVAPVSQRIGQLEGNLKDVVKSEEDRRTSAERIVLSLELGNLKRAVDRGTPYASEFADVQKSAQGKLDLSALARYQESGVSTLADLTSEFRSVASAILDAERTNADAGIVDRLLSGAKSIVRVRKTSHDADDKSVEAVVARMEDAIRDGRLAAVLDESKGLSDRGRAAARAWLDKVEARATVDKVIATVDRQLKAAIGGTPAAPKGVN